MPKHLTSSWPRAEILWSMQRLGWPSTRIPFPRHTRATRTISTRTFGPALGLMRLAHVTRMHEVHDLSRFPRLGPCHAVLCPYAMQCTIIHDPCAFDHADAMLLLMGFPTHAAPHLPLSPRHPLDLPSLASSSRRADALVRALARLVAGRPPARLDTGSGLASSSPRYFRWAPLHASAPDDDASLMPMCAPRVGCKEALPVEAP